ncbi:MAG: hypothetical protein KDD51_03005 [Bdellovibrionales bacterium]|nr:hypothetical protein [Bdellovibrionales bacterium]
MHASFFQHFQHHKAQMAFGVMIVALLVGGKLGLESVLEAPLPRRLALTPTRAAFQSKFLAQYHMGFNSVLADLLWIQFLQAHEHEPLQSGKVSWEFVQLDAVTTLDRRFERAFQFGAILLSVLRQDKLGARLILERWVKSRPDEWRPNYLYGYHLYFELGEFEVASKYILRAAGMEGAPYWLSSLGVRLLGESGAYLQALRVTMDLLAATRDTRAIERLERRVRSLNFELQKTSWEKSLRLYRLQEKREPRDLSDLAALNAIQARELSALVHSDRSGEGASPLLQERFEFHYDTRTKEIEPTRTLAELKLDRVGIYRPKGMNND